MPETVDQIKKRLKDVSADEFKVLKRSLAADERKGVKEALKLTERRLKAQSEEAKRIQKIYDFDAQLAREKNAKLVLGLDEVGRGPLAGPLAVGGVILDYGEKIDGVNDSKQVKPDARTHIAEKIKHQALAWTVQYIEPERIDEFGMTKALRVAFTQAIHAIEAQGYKPDLILLDGNPLDLDDREINIIKGDAQSAAIAAASIIAKVDRDEIMCAYAKQYPQYHFEDCKGYASEAHQEAIRKYGLCPIHRKSFCGAFLQDSLF
ncbi:MAG: ribonuclease HII [Eggerthellaceae bacterium]|jgi:ribonuclease HII